MRNITIKRLLKHITIEDLGKASLTIDISSADVLVFLTATEDGGKFEPTGMGKKILPVLRAAKITSASKALTDDELRELNEILRKSPDELRK